MLVRVFATECLKLKRTLALAMVLLAPLVVVVLQSLVAYFAADRLSRSGADPWPQIAKNTIGIWTLLMMPLFVTLETSLLAGLEHTDRNWKSLLALPCPRWTVYLSKLLVMIGMLWTAHLMLVGGTLLSVIVLKAVQPALKLGSIAWDQLVTPLAVVSAAALLGVTIQHWVSLRWQSFTAAIGFGMCAMVTGYVAVNSAKWGPWFPWSLPLHALRESGQLGGSAAQAAAQAAASHQPNVMLVALVGAALVAAVGCWDFSRRDITS